MTNRDTLVELTEAAEAFFAGTDNDTLTRLRRATHRARLCLDVCEPDEVTASRAGYAAGRAAGAG